MDGRDLVVAWLEVEVGIGLEFDGSSVMYRRVSAVKNSGKLN